MGRGPRTADQRPEAPLRTLCGHREVLLYLWGLTYLSVCGLQNLASMTSRICAEAVNVLGANSRQVINLFLTTEYCGSPCTCSCACTVSIIAF